MGNETVVVTPEPEGNSDFAAGVAAATAAQASEESKEAVTVSEAASEKSDTAITEAMNANDKAHEVSYKASDLEDRFNALETNVQAGFASLAEVLNGLKGPKKEEGTEPTTAPAPTPKEERQPAKESKPKKRRVGSFGAWGGS